MSQPHHNTSFLIIGKPEDTFAYAADKVASNPNVVVIDTRTVPADQLADLCEQARSRGFAPAVCTERVGDVPTSAARWLDVAINLHDN